jgi:hypothetical protein
VDALTWADDTDSASSPPLGGRSEIAGEVERVRHRLAADELVKERSRRVRLTG